MALPASYLPSTASAPLLPSTTRLQLKQLSPLSTHSRIVTARQIGSFRIQAVKVPPGVVVPKVQPKFQPPFWGFTRTAETWNSRACMIGLIGTFIVELILNKGILEMIGVEIGKGLDIPL